MLGTREGGDYSDFAGKEVSKLVKKVQKTLESNASDQIIVGTAINVLIASNPTLSTLVAVYKLGKWTYETYQKAEEVYEKTGDADKSAQVVANETIKLGIATIRDEVISSVVDLGWGAIKSQSGIQTNDIEDRILSEATKETLDEVLPK